MPQDYTVSFGVRAADGVSILVPSQDIGVFTVTGRMADLGLDGELSDVLGWNSTPVFVSYEWRLPDGSTAAVNGFSGKS